MSDPTYRIDAQHRPGEPESLRWVATAVRLSDAMPMFSAHGRYAQEAIVRARQWIAAENEAEEGFSVYVDDAGRPVEGHSVKA